ncbi:hypothetical protein T484DRAFT_1767931 [Baffinella frigidus]|nr:hypothetical protein T484DRAFT_1767931 [Cryptophyta sp. CCMP2293]
MARLSMLAAGLVGLALHSAEAFAPGAWLQTPARATASLRPLHSAAASRHGGVIAGPTMSSAVAFHSAAASSQAVAHHLPTLKTILTCAQGPIDPCFARSLDHPGGADRLPLRRRVGAEDAPEAHLWFAASSLSAANQRPRLERVPEHQPREEGHSDHAEPLRFPRGKAFI